MAFSVASEEITNAHLTESNEVDSYSDVVFILGVEVVLAIHLPKTVPTIPGGGHFNF